MSDAEIIKALECCSHSFCCDCPYEKYSENCTDKLLAEAHRFVKHQQAEIENLKSQIDFWGNHIETFDKIISQQEKELKTAKSEAIKEFADALKSKSELVAPSVYAVPYRAVSVEDIDKFVKIAGGEENES